MTYRALYRVWRPQTFADIVGQQHITRTLQNAIKQGRLSHAYLFSGPRGTGKTSAARVMAKAVNCERGPAAEPCNDCTACRQIAQGAVLDVVEIDAASNRGVEEIRDLREKVKYAPTEVRKKVYIIDEVHMLTTEAFNALLKTLEEPPEHVLFILATTEPYKLPLTIISRCQRFDFHRVAADEIVTLLAAICESERIAIEEAALYLIAQVAEGGLRDALSLLDQVYAFGDDRITEADIRAVIGTVADSFFDKIVSLAAKREASHVLDVTAELMQEGYDPEKFTHDLLCYFRDLLLVKTAPHLAETEARLRAHQSLGRVAPLFTEDDLFAMMEQTNETLQQMKWTSQPRVLLEMLLLKLTHAREQSSAPAPEVPSDVLAPLVKRVQTLERELKRLSGEIVRVPVQKQEGTTTPKVTATGKASGKRQQSGLTSAERQKLQTVWQTGSIQQRAAVQAKWPDVLSHIKEKNVRVHAWLMDGEPVAADGSHIVVAFKSAIHRETTEKPSHKQLIEEVVAAITGSDSELVTCMKSDWQQLEAQGGAREQAVAAEGGEDDHVQKALEWFGEDLVEIKD